ncbi:MAG TPA: DNA starvation/stationary phase protection protein Dps [Devosia sp.]|nr:DNA starvation/stationary phase protection protein Dps [Devosia sp.]
MTTKAPDIGLKSNTKTAMIELCNARLADALDLGLAVKQAHWNLKGPTFVAVHELLDMLRTHLDTHSDTVAERVAQLDGVALGTAQAVGEATALPAYPTDIRKVSDHLGALVERYAVLAKSVREAIDTADDAGDAGTADIFTAFSRDLDKDLWFLKSHLE